MNARARAGGRTFTSALRAMVTSMSARRRRRDFSSVELTRASGTLDGEGLQVNLSCGRCRRLRTARRSCASSIRDTLEIIATSGPAACATRGRQHGEPYDLRRQNAHHRHHARCIRWAATEADIAGSLPDTLALAAREYRASRCSTAGPIELKDPAGAGCGEAHASPSCCRTMSRWTMSPSGHRRILDGRAPQRAGGRTRSWIRACSIRAPIPMG